MDTDIDFYKHFTWLRKVNLRSPVNNETYQERLVRLEGDKESLVLQVSVLTDQVEAQGEKIRDLESSLDEHHHKLLSTEDMLQQELLSRTSLEGQRLDLMDEVSYLKLQLVGAEEEPGRPPAPDQEQQDKAEGLMQELRLLKSKVDELEGEKSQYERKLKATKLSISYSLHVCYQSLLTQLSSLKLAVEHTQVEKQQWEERWRSAQAEIADLQTLLATKDQEIHNLQSQLLARASTADSTDKEEVCRQLLEKYQEFHRLKVGMESLLASNDAKDRHIEELTVLLSQYRRMKEMVALTQHVAAGDRMMLCGSSVAAGDRMLCGSSVAAGDRMMLCGSSEEELSGSLKIRALTHKAHSDIIRSEMSSRGSSPLLMSPSSFQMDSSCRSFLTSMETSLVSPGNAGFHNTAWSEPRLLSTSLEELPSGSTPKHEAEQQVKPAPENRHLELNKYQTLPGKLSRSVMNGERERDKYSSPVQLSPAESHDNDYNLNRSRSASAPALGSRGKLDLCEVGRPERLDEAGLSDQSPLSSGVDSGQQSPVSPENRKSTRGIRKLWGKIRRSQSGSLQGDVPDLGDFKRGGFRATAGPRLARVGDTSLRDLKTPFSAWTAEQVCEWLEELGLGQYVVSARQWLTSGQTLLDASPQDLEKELGMKSPLHRKKLQLVLRGLNARPELSSELDHLWVTRWLDDIGLPQYKDQFNEGRVDGRMLQYLTVNDLLFLKVSSQLHHLSIKCAIHVLHVNKFHPHCLRRRPGDEASPSEVVQWSNHRVMEWLRSVDLAEYAPNLRGSGVHGGLIILEPRFNSDTLAMLLNIPPQKTLLRRHLATNFGSLVGPSAQREKRDYMESSGYAPLSTMAKVKPKKLGFGHLRRKRADDSSDYICPLESPGVANGPQAPQPQRPYSGLRGLSPILDRDRAPERREQVVITEGTVLRIEALSDGINNLTYLLSRDEVLKEMRRTQTALV